MTSEDVRTSGNVCIERNPHFHRRSMEQDGFCELCGEVNRHAG